MPYTVKGKCVYKRDGGAKVGCTSGSVDKYLAALHANADESVQKEEENKLVGGKADKMTADDIAKKHGVEPEKIKKQVKTGMEDEKKEHTKDSQEAKEIAMDHLVDYPNYYNNKKQMDKAAAKRQSDLKKASSEKEKVNEGTENTKQLIKRLIRENLIPKK